jgi:hypothetical protein
MFPKFKVVFQTALSLARLIHFPSGLKRFGEDQGNFNLDGIYVTPQDTSNPVHSYETELGLTERDICKYRSVHIKKNKQYFHKKIGTTSTCELASISFKFRMETYGIYSKVRIPTTDINRFS